MQWNTSSRMDFPLFITCLLLFVASAGLSHIEILACAVLNEKPCIDHPILGKIPVNSTVKRSVLDYGITKDDLESAVNFAIFFTNLSERLESNIRGKVAIERGTPSFGLNIAYRPEVKAMQRGRQALLAMRATSQLTYIFCKYQSRYDDCFDAITKVSLKDSPLEPICDHLDRVCTPEEYRFMYRSAEGTCNNIKMGRLGESFTGYSRLLPPDYSDHINRVRRARNKSALPNARKISSSVVNNQEILSDLLTMAVPLWGQFLEHDLSRFASPMMYHYNDSFDCCAKDGYNLAPRYQHPLCMAIEVPWDDQPFSAKYLRCMSYSRSLPAVPDNCHFGRFNQLNQATHFLDASQVYGTTFEKTSELRSFTRGMLKTHQMDDRSFLPLSKHPTQDCQVVSEDAACFDAGDPRANQHPLIIAMHTLWVREHNRLAAELAAMNEGWDDETLFQETRRIVIAEMQHITYDHWAAKILGRRSLEIIDSGKNYGESVDPTVSNSFATAAIRSLYSMFSDHIRLADENRESSSSSSIDLHDHFNNPEVILKYGVFDSLVRGLTSQSSGKVDRHYAEDLITKLFTNDRFGYDTLSLDIQRSRDHGIPSYNAYRSHCGLKKANNIQDLTDHMTTANVELLASLYSSLEDIDLIIGGLMETPPSGSQLGSTFACLLEDQLMRTRQGDRYFYTNEGQPKPFSTMQLKEIQKVTLARIICDNSDGIKTMQPDVFMKISSSNELMDCNSDALPRIDLKPWQEMYYTYSE